MLTSSRNGIARAGWQGASNVTVFSLICHKLFCTSLLKPKKSEAALLQSCWIASLSIHTCAFFLIYIWTFCTAQGRQCILFPLCFFSCDASLNDKAFSWTGVWGWKICTTPCQHVMYFRDLMNTVNAPSKGNFTNATCRSHHVSLIFGPKTTCIPRVVVHCWPQWRFCMHLCTV